VSRIAAQARGKTVPRLADTSRAHKVPVTLLEAHREVSAEIRRHDLNLPLPALLAVGVG